MKAVILAGGQGTRLRPLTINTPKAMVPIANTPFMEHFLSYLRFHGIDEAILALGHLPEAVARYFGDGSHFGIKITPSFENKPLGTAGAVKNAASLLDGPFFVFNGDIFTDIDLTAMASWHHEKKSVATIALTQVENPSAYGVLDIAPGGKIRRFVEKPPPGAEPSNLINAGVYMLEPEVLDMIPGERLSMFEHEVFPKMLTSGKRLFGYYSEAYWIDIGTPDKYLTVNSDIVSGKVNPQWLKLERLEILNTTKCEIEAKGSVRVGKGTVLGKGSILIGPCSIGHDCLIGENSILEEVVIWDGVKVGDGSFLKRCIVARDVCIGNSCRIPDGCVIGDNVHIMEGQTLLQNERLNPPDSASPSR
jgi:mannose-1-phosphate guanylyltransferase